MKLVKDEIKQLMMHWDSADNKTAAQADIYKEYSNLSARMFGNRELLNGMDCLRLLKQDGYDGKYVGSVSPQQAVDYLDHECLAYPPTQDAFRIGLFFNLSFYESVLLMLKNEYEKFIFYQNNLNQIDSTVEDTIQQLNDRQQLSDFASSIKENALDIYNIVLNHTSEKDNMVYDASVFENLLLSMISSKLILRPIDDDMVKQYIKHEKSEIKKLISIDQSVVNLYNKLKSEWLLKINLIENLLLRQERVFAENAKVKAKWATEFNDEWLKYCELDAEYYSLQLFLEEKDLNPEITLEEAKARVKEKTDARKAQLNKQIEFMKHFTMMHTFNAYNGTDEVRSSDDYKSASEYKKVMSSKLREIYKLTHTDKTENENFTETQIQELLALYQRATEFAQYEGTLMPIIDEIFEEAKAIWTNMGVESEITDVFPELDVDENIIDIAKNKIANLEKRENMIRDDIHVLLNDQEIKIKRSDLASMSAISDRKNSICDEISKLEIDIERAKEKISRKFKGK